MDLTDPPGAVISGCEASVIPADGSVTAIGNNVFRGMKMTQIAIPDSVKSIGYYSFAGCTLLGSVLLPDGVTSIGNNAFDGCASLSSFTVPLGTADIADGLLANCTALSSVTIHAGVKSVGAGAFAYCSSLSTVYYGGTEEEFSKIAVDNTSGRNYYFLNATVRYPQGNENACGDGVVWSFDEELGILTVSGEGAMYEYASASELPWHGICADIRSASFYQGVTSVSAYALNSCPNLASVFMAKTVVEVGAQAFTDCVSLSDVRFGGTLDEWQTVA